MQSTISAHISAIQSQISELSTRLLVIEEKMSLVEAQLVQGAEKTTEKQRITRKTPTDLQVSHDHQTENYN